MAKQFKFLDWQVYSDSRDLYIEIYKLTKDIPREYRYEITNQLLRASLSISLNIAEGSGKQSDKELNRFIEISLGSLYETLACVDVLKSINLIKEADYERLFLVTSTIAKQLGGLKKSLKL